MQSTYIIHLLDGIEHALSLLEFLLVLLKLLLALGQEDTTEYQELLLPPFLQRQLHLDSAHHLAQVGIGYAVLVLF